MFRMIFLSFKKVLKNEKVESLYTVYISDTYQRNEEQTMRKETLKKHVKNPIENDEFANDLNGSGNEKGQRKHENFRICSLL